MSGSTSQPVRLGPGAPAIHRVVHDLTRAGVRGARFYRRVGQLVRMPDAPTLRVGDVVIPLDPADRMTPAVYYGYYETSELPLVASLARPGGTVIDVGANLGLFSAVAAARVGPEGHVCAFEPSPAMARHLRAVFASSAHVEVVEVALGAGDGSGRLTAPKDERGLGTLRSGVGGQGGEQVVDEVRVMALDDHAAAHGEVALLKIDTEGWEPAVLAGAGRLLSDGRLEAMLIELTPSFGSLEWVPGVLSRLGPDYETFLVGREIGGLRIRPRLEPADAQTLAALSEQRNALVVRRDRLPAVAAFLDRPA